MRVLFRSQGLVDGGVAPRLSAGELPLLVYPSAHAAVDAHLLQLRFELRRKAQTFDRNQPRHILRIDAGIAQREIGAEGMGDDRDRCELLLVDELGDVIDIGRRRIAAVGGPLAVAMAPEVGRDRKSTRMNSSHYCAYSMPSSA